jgi:hypothetical protein
VRFVFLAALAVTAMAVPGSAAPTVIYGPLLTYAVPYSPDAHAGVDTEGGVCATGPEGHSFRITDPYRDRFPAWPDWEGEHFAFTRYRGRAPGRVGHISDVYVADTRDGHLRNLTARIGGKLNGPSAWSPDGSKLAFIGGSHGEFLKVVNADGTGSQEIASVSKGSLGGPDWSPFGPPRILFSRSLPSPAVYVVNADGSNETKLVDSATDAVWSPDGSAIAYLAMRGRQTAVVVARADGRYPDVLTRYGKHGSLAWSPTGDPDSAWIAFTQAGVLTQIQPDGTLEHAADTNGLPAADPAWLPGTALPSNRRPCVITGTRHTDVIRGTSRGDLINGRSGADTIYGLGGDDTIIGGSGRDRLYGGTGHDLFGARDGYPDVLSGGPGFDSAYFDKRDRLNSVSRAR